jgi:hypothetical protein
MSGPQSSEGSATPAERSAYRALQGLVRARPWPDASEPPRLRSGRPPAVVPAGALGQAGRHRVFLITDRSVLQSLLKEATLLPVDLAALIDMRARAHGFDPSPLLEFVAANPITQSGRSHREARARFNDHHQTVRKRLQDTLPALVRSHFQSAIDNRPTGSVARHLAQVFVDQVLVTVFECEHPELVPLYHLLAKRREQVFAFLHHPDRLADLSRTLAQAYEQAAVLVGHERFSVLLAYVLQGRDPLIGGLGAVVQGLVEAHPAARDDALRGLTAAALFDQAAPVNYVVREASSPVSLPDGYEAHSGDLLVLMLGWAATAAQTNPAESLAFGGGRHVCAGRALALEVAEHWLAGLRAAHHGIDWSRLRRDRAVGSAFVAWSERRDSASGGRQQHDGPTCPISGPRGPQGPT